MYATSTVIWFLRDLREVGTLKKTWQLCSSRKFVDAFLTMFRITLVLTFTCACSQAMTGKSKTSILFYVTSTREGWKRWSPSFVVRAVVADTLSRARARRKLQLAPLLISISISISITIMNWIRKASLWIYSRAKPSKLDFSPRNIKQKWSGKPTLRLITSLIGTSWNATTLLRGRLWAKISW